MVYVRGFQRWKKWILFQAITYLTLKIKSKVTKQSHRIHKYNSIYKLCIDLNICLTNKLTILWTNNQGKTAFVLASCKFCSNVSHDTN